MINLTTTKLTKFNLTDCNIKYLAQFNSNYLE